MGEITMEELKRKYKDAYERIEALFVLTEKRRREDNFGEFGKGDESDKENQVS